MAAAGAPATGLVRRLTWLLFFSQSIGSAGYIAGSTIGALVGARLSGQPALAGLPGAVHLLGSAATAYPAARFMERRGRRPGLVFGFSLGIGGALISGASVLLGSFPLFLLGYALLGASRGFTDLARYAAAEMHAAADRGRAISTVVFGGTLGAVLGPALVAPLGQLAESFRLEPLAGPWLASALLFLLGLLLIGWQLRPDPRDLGRQITVGPTPVAEPVTGPRRGWRALLRAPAAQTALTAMVLGQAVMVMLMAITSLHMQGHHHGLGDISFVISLHTLGMFGPSAVSGRLADHWGRAPVIATGAGLLIVAALLAPLSQETWVLALALFLLGLGWNFCYVAGAALLTDTLTVAERSRGQGSTDLLINFVSALGSFNSGVLFATLGYGLIAWLGVALALIPLALAWNLSRAQGMRPAPASD